MNLRDPEKHRTHSRASYLRHRDKRRAASTAYNQLPEVRAHRAAAEKRRRQARRAFLDRYKLAAGCFDCGYNAAPEALDFDHITRTGKTFSIAKRPTCPARALVAEINKCVVRCANCHRIKTRKERTCPSPPSPCS